MKTPTFDEIRNYIITGNRWGRNEFDIIYGEWIVISNGIRYALESKAISVDDILATIERFQSGNYGTFYGFGERPTPGREYGEYKSPLGESADTGAIMVHRESNDVVLYFHFER